MDSRRHKKAGYPLHMKGAKIGNNAIIGSNTIITNEIPCNCLAVGAPGKIVKTDVDWTREKLF